MGRLNRNMKYKSSPRTVKLITLSHGAETLRTFMNISGRTLQEVEEALVCMKERHSHLRFATGQVIKATIGNSSWIAIRDMTNDGSLNIELLLNDCCSHAWREKFVKLINSRRERLGIKIRSESNELQPV